MVSLSQVQASNARIASTLPNLVAVFVGGTNGIGEYTVKQFAKHASQPRAYIVGRSQEAADRIITECQTLNPDGKFTFIKADTSLIRNVDTVCEQIKSNESAINILCLSTGTLVAHTKSAEGLHIATALAHYARARFIENLLPELHAATSLRRVVTILTGTKEGPIDETDFQGWNTGANLIAARGRVATLVTLYLEQLARQASDISFIHVFPGSVKSGIARGTSGVMWTVIKGLSKVLGPFLNIPEVETGERHLFLATSARYPAEGAGADVPTDGIQVEEGVTVARGTDGKDGSGVYSVDEVGESQSERVEELLANYRKEGMPEKVWEHTQGEFRRIAEENKA